VILGSIEIRNQHRPNYVQSVIVPPVCLLEATWLVGSLAT